MHLEPVNEIGIKPQRKLLLDRPKEHAAAHRSNPKPPGPGISGLMPILASLSPVAGSVRDS
jgi:hypothetical protein